MRFFFGPVEYIGHPFYPHPVELVVPREVGGHELYCFSSKWVDIGPPLSFGPDVPAAVVLFDPMWLHGEHVDRIRDYAASWGVPLVGVLGDWYSGMRPARPELFGTRRIMRHLDALVVDRCGASALRYLGFDGPVVEHQEMHSYGRMLQRGQVVDLVLDQDFDRERTWDVGFVGHRYPEWVPQRSEMLDRVKDFCARQGYSFLERRDVQAAELEGIVENCRVTFNLTPGYALNIRVYEAMSCGSLLVTERWNRDAWSMLPGYAIFYDQWPGEVERAIDVALTDDLVRSRTVRAAAQWVVTREPWTQWGRVLDAAAEAVRLHLAREA